MVEWRKSTYSGSSGGQCVETASDTGTVLVRDTANQNGCTLSVPAAAWERFTKNL